MGGLVILMELRRRMSALRTTLRVPDGPEGSKLEEVSGTLSQLFSLRALCINFLSQDSTGAGRLLVHRRATRKKLRELCRPGFIICREGFRVRRLEVSLFGPRQKDGKNCYASRGRTNLPRFSSVKAISKTNASGHDHHVPT